MIYDEYGPVLVTYPNTFADERKENRTIQLFHIGDYFEEGFEQVQNIPVVQRFVKNGIFQKFQNFTKFQKISKTSNFRTLV